MRTGRYTVIIAMLLASLVAPALKSLDQAYQFIQEYVGFISPGVLAIFLLGFFWKRTNSAAALTAAILTIPLSTFLKFLPRFANLSFLAPFGFSKDEGQGYFEIPFLDRMGIVFIVLVFLMVIISLIDPKSKHNPKALEIDRSMFKSTPGFIVASVLILGILAALYTVFW